MMDLKSILLVEDSKNDVELTLAALEGYHLANEVIVMRNGEEALNFLLCRGDYRDRAEGNPALIMLDLKMPKVNGLDVLRTIRSTDRLKHIPVVILTSSREEQDLLNTYGLGINGYVVKPVDLQQFMDAVRQIGAFFAILNEPPVGTLKRPMPNDRASL